MPGPYSSRYEGDPELINWGDYKPIINTTTLLKTKGPSSHPDREPSCIICLANLETNDDTLTHPNCSYTAHKECLEKWLHQQKQEGKRQNCPMCTQGYILRDMIVDYTKSCEDIFVRKLNDHIMSHVTIAEGGDQPHVYMGDLTRELPDHPALLQLQYDRIARLKAEIKIQRILRLIQSHANDNALLRLENIRRQAEDLLADGVSWNMAKKFFDARWQNWDSLLFWDLCHIEHDVNAVASMSRLTARDFHAPKTGGSTALEAQRIVINRQIKDFTRALWQAYIPNLQSEMSYLKAVHQTQTQTEQFDYCKRTGEWWPPEKDDDSAPDLAREFLRMAHASEQGGY